MARVLVTEQLAERGLDLLRSAGHEVDVQLGLSPDELLAAVPGAAALVIRSATKVTADVLEAGRDLVVVGRAGVGVDNVDVETATRRGVMVVNAPQSNIVSTAEHTMGLLLAQARNIPQGYVRLKGGTWERARWEGVELQGKVLAILGLGRIGSLVAQRANAFGMRVVAWDPFVTPDRARRMGVELLDMDEVRRVADFVSVHLVKRPEYLGIIGDEFLSACKPNLVVVNVARGGLVDEDALARALAEGRVAGAALDVFEDEPKEGQPKASPLFDFDSVVVTPHLAASTTEAQDKAGVTIAEQVLLALRGDFVPFAVNVDATEAAEPIRPFLPLAQRLGSVFAGLCGGLPDVVELEFQGALTDHDTRILELSALRGLLAGTGESVSFVNAPQLVEERGLQVRTTTTSTAQDFVNLITIRGGEHAVGGTLTGPRSEPRIVMVDDHTVDIPPVGTMVVVRNDDRPGVIGVVGTVLGREAINISDMDVGRSSRGGTALMVLATDQPLPPAVADELRAAPGILDVRQVVVPA